MGCGGRQGRKKSSPLTFDSPMDGAPDMAIGRVDLQSLLQIGQTGARAANGGQEHPGFFHLRGYIDSLERQPACFCPGAVHFRFSGKFDQPASLDHPICHG